ncbi:MAG: hypothetical protein U0821_04625 [Chloroflexota bacterium]
MLRAPRPTDLVGLTRFLRNTATTEITGHTWPKIQPESGHLPLSEMVWQAVGAAPTRGRAWIAFEDEGIAAVAVARARSSGLVWDVEHLHVTDGMDGSARELLDHVSGVAVEAGARRVFIETPSGARGADVARRAGFERYTGQDVYRIDPPVKILPSEMLDGRPRLRADETGLFHLYGAAVPPNVRLAEAMTADEWAALHRGRKRWAPTIIGDRHQYVWELGTGIAGWLEVVYGQKSQCLDLLIDPKYETMIDRFVSYALQQVSPKAPVFAAVREYQAGLGPGLERVGFRVTGQYDIYVRQLTARVLEPKMMPAGILGG